MLRRARTRAGLSSEELADRLGTDVARLTSWEAGDPPFSVVERVVEACQMDLARVISEPDPDPHDVSLLEESLRLSVDERLERMLAYVRFIEAGRAALRERL